MSTADVVVDFLCRTAIGVAAVFSILILVRFRIPRRSEVQSGRRAKA